MYSCLRRGHLGDTEFAEFVTADGENNGVKHSNDASPHLPVEETMIVESYRLISSEYWILEARNAEFSVEKDQIKVISGYESLLGNHLGKANFVGETVMLTLSKDLLSRT